MNIARETDQKKSSDSYIDIYMCVHCTFSLFFPHRVKLKEGVTFLGARPSNPTQWIVSQDVRSEGHRVVTLHCRRKESSYDQQRSAHAVLFFKLIYIYLWENGPFVTFV